MKKHQARRDKAKQKLKTQILRTAEKIYVKEGFEAVTMRRLADSISYTATTLYLYFDNRDAIFGEMAKQSFDQLDASLAAATREHSALEDLRRGLETTLRFGLSQPNHFFLLFPFHPSTCNRIPHSEGTRILHWFEQKLQAACLETRAHWIAPPKETAALLLSSIYGMVSLGAYMIEARAFPTYQNGSVISAALLNAVQKQLD